jgi:ATP-binding cassette, subfamily F, member 2
VQTDPFLCFVLPRRPSDSKKKRLEKRAMKKGGSKLSLNSEAENADVNKAANGVEELALGDRSSTGVLTSHPQSRDVQIESVTLLFHGHELLTDTKIEFNYGRRYGLIGPNGCGKSTLLKALGARELPIPNHIDVFLLDREMEASDMTALEAVMAVDEEKSKLEKEVEELSHQEGPEAEARLEDIYERLDALDSDTAEARAASILHGLGFNKEMQAKKTRDFSGGWRMRISLARALFVEPTFLILDEPTNHLDLEACVWLEDTLKNFKRILLLVSHSQDFLNGVCTNIIHMHQKQLKYYGGKSCSRYIYAPQAHDASLRAFLTYFAKSFAALE